MCLKNKIVCKKILKHICRNIMIPEYRYKKYYKNKKQLYNAIYRGYVSLDAEGKAVVGNIIGFCPHCLAKKEPYSYRTVAHNMRFYSEGEALDKFVGYIREISSAMEIERRNKVVKK